MRTYEKYKDSGIGWVGKVPEDWRKCRFKNIMNLITDASTSNNKIGLENIESGTGKFVQTDSEFEGNGVAFMPHDIVYGKLRPYLQKVWCADFEGNAVGDFFVFRNKCNSVSSFLKYVLLSNNFTQFANGTTYGAKMPRVSSNAILDQEYYIPTLSEQEAIANYLDKKTAEIDKIIAEREKKIELLNELKSSIISRAVTKGINPHAKMKDSGIDWIGEIPEEWDMKKMNLVCKVITDFVASGSFADLRDNVTYMDHEDYAMLIRTADLSKKSNTISHVYVNRESYEFLSNSNLFGNEIILPNIGASIGDVYMVPKTMYEHMTLGPNSIMVKTRYNDFYYYNYFKSRSGRESLLIIGQAAAQGKFNKTQLRQMRVPVPPLVEQEAIVSFINTRVSKIDALAKVEFSEIKFLREYRQSLISEVVTGKRKVID